MVAELPQPRALRRHDLLADLRRPPEAHDERHRQRPRAHAALVPATVDHGREPHARPLAPHVERAHTLGAVDQMRRAREEVDAHCLRVHRDLADRLGGVRVEDDPLLFRELPDRGDVLDRADLVVREHDRDEDRLVRDRLLHVVHVHEAVRLHRDGRHLAPLPLEPLAGVEPRALLDRRRDDVVTLLAVHLGDAFQRQVDRLGATRGEHDLLGVARADEARDLRPRGVDGALGLPPEGMVPARGMTEPLGEVGQHRLDDSRVARCRRLRIHEDRELHGHRLGLLSPQARIDKSFGTSSFVSSARLIVSSIWVIATWSFWTGRRRLHRGSCGQPPWSKQLTMLMGPSSARITSPTVILDGWRESAYPPFGPLWLMISRRFARRCRILARSSGGMPNSSAIRLALTAPTSSWTAI